MALTSLIGASDSIPGLSLIPGLGAAEPFFSFKPR
jgi:hypothetical protein